ncbi:MAG: hypothetical protein ACJAX4_004648 [Clostridium sp.]|jgi:hypothetical protein
MNDEKKYLFFNILTKTQLISIFFLLVVASINISNNLNLISISYIYLIVIINISISMIVFHCKLDNSINNIFKRFLLKKLIHDGVIILCMITYIIYGFFPKFDFITKHISIISTILFILVFLTTKNILIKK